MDKTAIETIQKTALAASINEALAGVGVFIKPDGYTTQELEKFEGTPRRFRARFETDVIGEFIEYVANHADDNTALFIDARAPSAAAIIDMGSPAAPRWGDHRAKLILNKTPAYQALIDKNDKAMPQQSFIDFITDWGMQIKLYDENIEEISLSSGITRLRSLKINASASNEQKTDNFAASRSALESIEVQAAGQQPPAIMAFTTCPHEGFGNIEFKCEIRALVTGKDVQLKYRIIALEQIENIIAEELVESLHVGLNGTDLSIHIGTMNYQ